MGFPGGSAVKTLPANAEDMRDSGLIPGLGRSPGEGNGNPLQYSCLENRTDGGAQWATVHSITESETAKHTCTHVKIMKWAHSLLTIHSHTKSSQCYWPYSLLCMLHTLSYLYMTGGLCLLIHVILPSSQAHPSGSDPFVLFIYESVFTVLYFAFRFHI